jgi:tRNA-splicing ligase RtcB
MLICPSTRLSTARTRSRTAHGTRRTDRKTGVVKREGLVKPEMMAAWLSRANVVLRGGGLDESPDCYKRLPQVLAAHGSTIRILHTLTPLGVAMAGANEFDPYKD